jgi:hypothetical protein
MKLLYRFLLILIALLGLIVSPYLIMNKNYTELLFSLGSTIYLLVVASDLRIQQKQASHDNRIIVRVFFYLGLFILISIIGYAFHVLSKGVSV